MSARSKKYLEDTGSDAAAIPHTPDLVGDSAVGSGTQVEVTTEDLSARPWLSAGQVATALGGVVAPRTISRWADEGKIPYARTLGGGEGNGHRRFPPRVVSLILELSGRDSR